MAKAVQRDPASAPVLVIDIGNSTTHVGTWRADRVATPLSIPTHDQAAFREAFLAHAAECPKGRPAAVAVASVVPQALERLRSHVDKELDQEALVVGDNLPLPIDVAVKDPSAIGVDRVCAAAAAYEKLQATCAVVDFGTAVTVDLVDDDGTLLGGAILPGIKLQLQALHEHTAVLPEVEAGVPDRPYGRTTAEAIQTGVCRGIVSAVRGLVESYATALNRWPHCVATGGDLKLLADHCDFLDTLVPHLTLQGVGLAYRKHLTAMGV